MFKRFKKQKEINQLFQSIDIDHSGYIDEKEFISYFQSYFKLDSNDEKNSFYQELSLVFYLSDKDSLFTKKDNKISKKEFTNIYFAIPIKRGQSKRALIGEFLFNIIDDNKSGKINEKELKQFSKLLYENDDFNSNFLIELDKNGDGKIDLKEFLKWYCFVDKEENI